MMGNYFSYEEKHSLRRLHLFFKKICEYGNYHKFRSISFRVTHSGYIGRPITAHRNATPWLR